jgi:uncharacterized protein YyaL (SSP411 family)
MPAIAWLPWSATSFAQARADARPILLFLTTTWCGPCADMDRTTFTDADVMSVVAARFLPIRVDADRRPDIAHRYALGGFPTTAFLTPDGEIIGGGTFVDGRRLSGILERVAAAFAEGRHMRGEGSAGQPVQRVSDPLSLDELTAHVLAHFDRQHGGFGDHPKFPHVAPVRLALTLFKESGSQEARSIAATCLDAMGWGPLYDENDGGFYRCADDADWTRPQREKLLDVNASLLSLYVEAFEILGLARYAERAEDTLRYLQTWLADPVDGGWAASQQARADESEPARDEGVETAAASAIDRTVFADWNALMISAALQAGRVMSDAGLSEFAIKSLERVVLRCYRPGMGVAHYVDRQVLLRRPHQPREVRGLLEDQVAMMQAHLDAFDATGNVVYEMMAEELALYALRTLWDEQEGGFMDRAPDVHEDIGLVRQPYKPFGANCLAARVLDRLAKTSGNETFAARAARTLEVMSGLAAAQGPLGAEYVLSAKALAQR